MQRKMNPLRVGMRATPAKTRSDAGGHEPPASERQQMSDPERRRRAASKREETKMSKLIYGIGIIMACILTVNIAARAEGRVTDVALGVEPSSLQSRACPVTVVFNGYIKMDGPGVVTYQIIRSDGAAGAPTSIEFTKSGVHPISEAWTLGDGAALPHYEGWMAIRVLSPNAVESSRDGARFIMTCSDTPSTQEPRRARFRVSLTGFSAIRETRDHLFEADGPGDEIYQAPYVVVIDRTGTATAWRTGAHGAIFGGIRTGRRFPTATPWVLSGTPTGLGIPGVLFEGELIEGERAVALAPTLWEWDGPERQLLEFWGACAAARTRIASSAIPILTGPFPARYGGLSTALDGLITLPITPEGDADRPLGISVSGAAGSFTPRFILLTYEGAMASVAAAGIGGDIYAVSYRDPDGFDGDYTLFVKVEQLP